MAISSVSGGDRWIKFLGKMPSDLENGRFSYKNRIVYHILDDLEESGLLEIVPGTFFRKEHQNVHFLSRHNNGIYLEYSGTSEAGFGAGNFYMERLDYWLPDNSKLGDDVLEGFKKDLLADFKRRVISSKHSPSEQEVNNFNLLRERYYQAMEVRDIVSG